MVFKHRALITHQQKTTSLKALRPVQGDKLFLIGMTQKQVKKLYKTVKNKNSLKNLIKSIKIRNG
jgi:hypothetical protein